MYELVAHCTALLPAHKPRYLMGVGTPANLLECVARGVDMFDCVMPTRNARHGLLFTWQGVVNIKNAKYKTDFGPLDAESDADVDQRYSRAYLRHLFVAGEWLALEIATRHNLAFYLSLMRAVRRHIAAGTFAAWKEQMVPQLSARL
jgi:queuine tRNA-ribosyltransferase